jgi:hypothetical protein
VPFIFSAVTIFTAVYLIIFLSVFFTKKIISKNKKKQAQSPEKETYTSRFG